MPKRYILGCIEQPAPAFEKGIFILASVSRAKRKRSIRYDIIYELKIN
jgi:hypothetical protein